MKAVILAGGLGTRITEESALRPKPMVEIGDKPILWHIMKFYSHFGVNEFVICAGYRGYQIKEYFQNYWLHNCDVTFDMRSHEIEVHQDANEPWRVTVVDTGLGTMTGGRILRVRPYVDDGPFMLTYGDGLADIDLRTLQTFHETHGRIATVTAVQPQGRFGAMDTGDDGAVHSFIEKPHGDGGWVNGGFFMLDPAVFDFIDGDETVWEREPLEQLAQRGQLGACRHAGFWQPMDTLRDKRLLEDLWASGSAPWRVW